MAESTGIPGLTLPSQALATFCRRWGISELAVFGSAARGELKPDSDVDVLFTIEPDATIGLWDLTSMEDELAEMLGRPVELVSRASILQSHNWLRRRAILDTARVVYAAR